PSMRGLGISWAGRRSSRPMKKDNARMAVRVWPKHGSAIVTHRLFGAVVQIPRDIDGDGKAHLASLDRDRGGRRHLGTSVHGVGLGRVKGLLLGNREKLAQ